MSKLYDLLYAMIGKLNSSVKTTAQTLTDAEKTQARANIGAQVAGDYAKKSEIPTVPTKVSAFTNDVGYLTQHQNLSAYAKKDEIPSKLPNPHALTINGKTYDGSSAVSVTVEGGSGGADWNAAEGEPGHVKHRTHWIDVDIVEILPETQAKIQSSQYDEALSFVPLLEVKQGDIITVAINGMEYKCAAQAFRNNMYVFGDGNYFGFGNSGAGEPFCVLYMAGSNSGVYVKQDCTISIYKDNSIIHKLDKKFLPDDIGGGADWNASEGEPGHVLNRTHWAEGGIELLAEIRKRSYSGNNVPFAPVVGKEYTVTFGETSYHVVGKRTKDSGYEVIYIGNANIRFATEENTGEPWVYFGYSINGVMTTSALQTDENAMAETISVYQETETVHKLPGKFLPEGLPYVEGGMVKIPVAYEWPDSSGAIITSPIGLKAGNTYTVVWAGVEYVVTAREEDIDGATCVVLGNTTGETTEPFMIVELPAEDATEMGFYGIAVDVTGGAYIDFTIHGDGEVVHKLDPKFLPDGVGGIMVVSVKSIDMNTGDIFVSHTAGEIANAMGAGKIVFMNIEGMPFIVNGDVESDGDGNITGVGFNVINAPTVTARVDANGEVTISEAQ